MLKKFFLILICLFFAVQKSFSKEISVKIKPLSETTTSNLKLQNGDSVKFLISDDVKVDDKLVLKKGREVFGTVTSREENGFMNEAASVYIENFYVKNGDERINLKGIVYKEGKSHDVITGFLPIICIFVRGGEVQIKPETDDFTLYYEGGK